MRIGLIADIHGNLVALEAVLSALELDRVDRLLCLGDVAVLGPQPAGVTARLRELNIPSVLGNTDAWLLDDESGSSSEVMRELAKWSAGKLSEADWTYLRSSSMTMDVDLGDGRSMLCFHGSPRSFDEVISATTPDGRVAEILAGHRFDVFIGGHTHIQLLRRHGDALILNPGSVGLPGVGPGTPDLPVNRQVHWAEYAVLDVAGGDFSVTFRRIPLDLEQMLDAAGASGMPHRDWWIDLWDDDWRRLPNE